MNKIELRAKYKIIRNNIKDRNIKNKKIFNKVINDELILPKNTILIYVSINSEVDTINIINYFLGKKNIAVPKIVNNEMKFCLINSLEVLEKKTFGIYEPIDDNYLTCFDDSICITPGICFDKNNYRIGYGKGFYDRFLNEHNILTIGLCYKECLIDKIDNDEFDYKVERVITD